MLWNEKKIATQDEYFENQSVRHLKIRNETYLSARPDNFQLFTPLDLLDRAIKNQPDS